MVVVWRLGATLIFRLPFYCFFGIFPSPASDSIILKEVLSEEGILRKERGFLLFFFLIPPFSWGLGCHVTLWMNFSSVLVVSIKTLLSGWEIGINLFPCGRCNINCLSQF